MDALEGARVSAGMRSRLKQPKIRAMPLKPLVALLAFVAFVAFAALGPFDAFAQAKPDAARDAAQRGAHPDASAPSPLPAPHGQAALPASSAASASEPGEPNVKRTVIEDDSARIEEVRVRGQLQHVTVTPRGTLRGYEIITGDGSRDLSFGANTSRGATGKRVWSVLRF